MKILKRYYKLYNVLIQRANLLEEHVKIITENTRFQDHFDIVLFHKYIFHKFIQEDIIIKECHKIAEEYSNTMFRKNNKELYKWSESMSSNDYWKI